MEMYRDSETLWQSSSSSQAQLSGLLNPGPWKPQPPGWGVKDAALPFNAPELGRGSEGLVLGDGEHKQKAFSAAEVVVSDGCVVLLAGCVQNVYLDLFSIEDHLLPVTVSFGGLIVFYKLEKQSEVRTTAGP